MICLRNKTKKMLRKYQTKNLMMQTQKWTKLEINQDCIVLLRMKIIWNQFLISIPLQEKTDKEIHQALIFLPKTKHTKHQWTSLWNGMIYPNKMQENIWNKNSIKTGRNLMLTIKVLLIQLKHSNSRDNLWAHSQVWLMVWIPVELIPSLISRKLIWNL